MSQDVAKKAAAEKALEWIESEMIVGLGSGTTSHFFIEALARQCLQGLSIRTVASSKESAALAKKSGLMVTEINEVSHIDVTVDGADEVDAKGEMIKGAGSAHVREKILAFQSKKLIIIIDETKLVQTLGKAKLPVEVLFYGAPLTKKTIEEKGLRGKWRVQADQTLFVTDNGNCLLDLEVPPGAHLQSVDRELREIPGVVATGFFPKIADKIIVGSLQGSTRIIT